MDRRDIPPEDRYGGGQSYRPGNVRTNRSPPPRRDRDLDGYGARSPPRRPYDARGPPRGMRSRSPPGREPYRRRSPSPRDKFGVPRGGDSYRVRPRSPFRRDDGPRDGPYRDNGRDFRDSRGPRDGRDFSGRSPPRFRSPARGSPPFRGRRTPPGLRRDRSPPRRFDDYAASQPHSPPRRRPSPHASDREYPSRPRSPIGPGSDRQRPRSPSPRGFRARDLDDRGRESTATSRKSSPPVHASRLAIVQDHDEARSGRPSPRGAGVDTRPRSPEPRRTHASPPRDRDGDIVLPDAPAANGRPREPPSGPSADRAAPTRPSAVRTFAPPPAGPRGDAPPSRGAFAPRGRGGYNADYPGLGRGSITATFRGGRGGAPGFGGRPPYDRDAVDSTPHSFGPAGPRPVLSRPASITQRFDVQEKGASDEPRGPLTIAQNDAYRRPPTGPSAAPSGPPSGPAGDRARDRLANDGVHPALRGLPEIMPNGKKIPPVADHARLLKLEEETERLRKALQEKEIRKRRHLREWDRLERESRCAVERSMIAEQSVKAFDGEVDLAGSAF